MLLNSRFKFPHRELILNMDELAFLPAAAPFSHFLVLTGLLLAMD